MQQITLRLSEDTLESLEDAAEDAGRTRSKHIRSVIESREDADEVRSEYEERLDELRREHEAELDELRSEHEQEVKELRQDVKRLRNEKRTLINDREERTELVRYVEEERSLSKQKAQAGIVTRAKWFLTGMPTEGAE